MEAIYCVAGKDAFEAVSYHPYSRDGVNLYWLRQLRQLSLRYGHPQCEQWITEYDWTPIEKRKSITTTYGCSDAEETVPSDGITLCSRYPFVTQLYLHTLNDWGDTTGWLPSEGFGLLNSALEKKPKYEEYRQALLWRRDSLAREMAVDGPDIVFAGEPFELRFDDNLLDDMGPVRWHTPERWTITGSDSNGVYTVTPPQDAASYDPGSGRVTGGAMAGDTYQLTAVRKDGVSFTHHVEVVDPLQLACTIPTRGARGKRPAVVEALVSNLDDNQLSGVLKVDLPDGWRMVGGGEFRCGPGRSLKRQLRFVADRNVAPGSYRATVHLSYAGRVTGRCEFTLIKNAESVRTVDKTIDGSLADWDDAEWIEVPGEASPAEFAAAWSEDSLCFAVRVRDEKHVVTKPLKEAWLEDSIQFAVDSDCDPVPGALPTLRDYEMIFALKDGRPQHYRYTCPVDSYGGEVDGLQFEARAEGGLTTYEISIPWQELGISHPRQGREIGLCVVVNDSDGGERRFSTWGLGVIRGKLPIGYARIELAP